MHQEKLRNGHAPRELMVDLFFAYLTAITLTMDFPLPSVPDSYAQPPVVEILWNLIESTRNHSAISTLLFACLAYIRVKLRALETRPIPSVPISIASALIALCWLLGRGYQIDDSVYHLFASGGQVVKSTVYFCAMTWLIFQCTRILFVLLHRSAPDSSGATQNSALRFLAAHSFLVPFVFFLICWVPHILIAFPGNTCFDVWDQISQYNGVLQFTSHHPPVHTLFMGSIISLGVRLGSGELGIFLFSLIQMLCAAAVMAYSVFTLCHFNAPKWLSIGAILFYAFTPYLSSYTTVLLKDNLYSYAFVLYMIELFYLLVLQERFFRSPRHILLFCLSVCSVIWMRNNGKYVIYFMTAVILLIALLTKKRRPVRIPALLCILIVPLLLSAVLNAYCVQKYDIQKGSIAEALSLPLQQTARYVKMHGDEVTEAERKAINGVISYDILAEQYDPQISDPVKANFYQDVAPRELINYLKVWVKQFLKHPETYFHATANQNYYLLYPVIENTTIYSDTYFSAFEQKYPLMEGFEAAVRTPLTQAETADRGLFLLAFSSPVLGFLMHPATSNLLLIFLCIFAVYTKKWGWLLHCLPLILSVGIILLSPVIQGHPRYAFPILFSMPVLIAHYLLAQNQQITNGSAL